MPNIGKATENLQTKIYEIDPRQIESAPKNARYMTRAKMARFVENLKRDGTLTSIILVIQEKGKLVCISGHHRRDAAIAAGLSTVTVMEILTPLTPERRVALQLSHNAVVGEDDPSVLMELYQELPLEEKNFSGLNDEDFKLDSADLERLNLNPFYREISLLFLPEEAEKMEKALDKLGKHLKKEGRATYWAMASADFDRAFEAIALTKKQLKISNNALAFRAMAELALERLAQLETEP